MGRKKKQRAPIDEPASSEEGMPEGEDGVGGCPHVTRGLDLAHLLRSFRKKTSELETCKICEGATLFKKEEGENTQAEGGETLWLCLRCGILSCGPSGSIEESGSSIHAHVIKHFFTPHSDLHCLCVALSAWNIWCFECKREVSVRSSKKLTSAINSVKRELDKPHHSPGGEQGSLAPSVTSQSCEMTTIDEKNLSKPLLPPIKPPLEVKLPEADSLLQALCAQVKHMSSHGSRGPLNPGHLFGHISNRAPQFRGGDMHDSHELLRIFLDFIQNEEIRRCKEAILVAFGLSRKTNPQSVEESVHQRIRAYGHQAKDTLVEWIFGGVFLNVITCETCHEPSLHVERFMDVSLPVVEERVIRPRKKGVVDVVDGDSPGCFGKSQIPSGTNKYQQKRAKQEKRLARRKEKAHKVFVAKSGSQPSQDDHHLKKEKKEIDSDPGGGEQKVEDGERQQEKSDNEEGNDLEATCKVDANADIEENEESELVHFLDLGLTLGEAHPLPQGSDVISADSGYIGGIASSHSSGSPGLASNKLSEDSGRLTGQDTCSMISVDDVERQGLSQEEICTAFSISQNETVGPKCLQSDDGLDRSPTFSVGCGDTDLTVEHGSLDSCSSGSPHYMPSLSDQEVELDDAVVEGVIGEEQEGSSSEKDPHMDESMQHLKQHFVSVGLKSLGPKYHVKEHECSIESLLARFTSPELLMGANKIACQNCSQAEYGSQEDVESTGSVFRNASQQGLILVPPAILTLHLKRFEGSSIVCRKVTRHVSFPLLLDLAPYCSDVYRCLRKEEEGQSEKMLYSLYAVVEHSGTMNSGHYVAYVKSRPTSPQFSPCRFLNYELSLQGHLPSLLHRFASWQAGQQEKKKEEGSKEGENGSKDPHVMSSGKWYYVSDSRVMETTEAKVLHSQAYLLFYERIS
ncbi:unnamed protein product [Darwinula stevensoni]|uniref:Ubiquitinyl hydrolase 1 n=1 Tax=Darwinula stevensoni TaxID=69355 RepID=A0A7R8X9C9_9CRUS|nr:unnamed protein product [Darwinula stevensoni]CAG0884372.1 unnamed protein product [Darwinula stevensoni]